MSFSMNLLTYSMKYDILQTGGERYGDSFGSSRVANGKEF